MAVQKIIRELPFAEYAARDDEHATQLRRMLISPLAYHRSKCVPWVVTDATRGGQACHTAVLEPEKFRESFAVWSGGRRAGNDWNAFRAENAGKTIITAAQHAAALRMCEVVRNHAVAREYLEMAGDAELSILWTHERTGIRIKCRIDWLCAAALVDLKTTADPSPRKFANSAVKFGYPLQLALYSDAIVYAGLEPRPVKIIAVQSSEPHDVVVYDVGEDVLAQGRADYECALDMLATCQESDSWPGIAPDSELPLVLPPWASAANDDQEEPLTFDGQAIF